MHNLLLPHNLSLYLICLFYKKHFKGPSTFSLWSSLKRHGQWWACKHPLVAMTSCSYIRKVLPKKFQFLSAKFYKFVLLVFLWASRSWNHTRPKPCKEQAQEEVCPSVVNLPLKKRKVSFLERKATWWTKKTPSGWKLFLAEALYSPRRATAYAPWDTRDEGLPAHYTQRCTVPHTKVPAYFLTLWSKEAVTAIKARSPS